MTQKTNRTAFASAKSTLVLRAQAVDTPYYHGYAAHARKQPRDSNPYLTSRSKARAWYKGWDAASNGKGI
jgi:hypothetical protein